jgi:hypothetical protein
MSTGLTSFSGTPSKPPPPSESWKLEIGNWKLEREIVELFQSLFSNLNSAWVLRRGKARQAFH